jgi:hypothetical protein
MIESNKYTCQPIRSDSLNGTFNMIAFNESKDRGIELKGIKIFKELRVGDLTLVITYYDSLDAVTYWFNLISENLTLVDTISTPAYFGFMENIEINFNDNSIEFGFFDTEDRWKLKSSSKGRYSFKPSELFRRPSSMMFSKRYLWLTKQ